MTGLVTVKDGASVEAINKIIDEYNAQTKREAEAFESLKICRDVYEQTLSDNALNNYENALEWYLKMTDVTENMLTILEAYGGVPVGIPLCYKCREPARAEYGRVGALSSRRCSRVHSTRLTPLTGSRAGTFPPAQNP